MPIPVRSPEISDPVILARYPFLPQAKAWLETVAESEGIGIESLLNSVEMGDARQRGKLRLVEMVTHRDGVDMQTLSDIHDLGGQITEAFSFAFARMVICASNDSLLLSRWAQSEAELAGKRLSLEGDQLASIAHTYVKDLQHELRGNTRRSNAWDGKTDPRTFAYGRGVWKVGLADYVEMCPRISGSRWRLPNHDVSNGWVSLRDEPNYCSDAQLARLLRERIKQQIIEDTQHRMETMRYDIIEGLEEHVEMLTQLTARHTKQRMELSMIDQSDWPPCVHKAVTELDQGENLNHTGRLFLASFAAKIEMPQADCAALFHNAPDYNAETTNYQISQIYNVGYTPASCDKLKMNSNCPVLPGDDRLCDQDWMTHPLKYLRAKQRNKQPLSEDKKPSK